MKFKKTNLSDDMMVSFDMRRVFAEGRTMTIKWEYEVIEGFHDSYHFGFKPYNRKRDTYSYYKSMYRIDYNDGECFWNGEEP